MWLLRVSLASFALFALLSQAAKQLETRGQEQQFANQNKTALEQIVRPPRRARPARGVRVVGARCLARPSGSVPLPAVPCADSFHACAPGALAAHHEPSQGAKNSELDFMYKLQQMEAAGGAGGACFQLLKLAAAVGARDRGQRGCVLSRTKNPLNERPHGRVLSAASQDGPSGAAAGAGGTGAPGAAAGGAALGAKADPAAEKAERLKRLQDSASVVTPVGAKDIQVRLRLYGSNTLRDSENCDSGFVRSLLPSISACLRQTPT